MVVDPVTARQPDSADRRCRRLGKDVTGTQSTARYGGASPCRYLFVDKQLTKNQCIPAVLRNTVMMTTMMTITLKRVEDNIIRLLSDTELYR